MTSRFAHNYRALSGGKGIRSIVGCLLAASLVGAPAASGAAPAPPTADSSGALAPQLIAAAEKKKDKEEDRASAKTEAKSDSGDEKSKKPSSSGSDQSKSAESTAVSGDDSEKPKKGLFRKAKETLIGKDKDEKAAADKETDEQEKKDGKAEKKAEKSDGKQDKSESKADDDDDDKADRKAERKAETKGQPAEAKTEAPPAAVKEPAPDLADDDDDVQPLLPDAGLISILKDVSRSLKESEDVAKIEDPCQKAAISVGAAALAKAVDNPDLIFNRIITARDKERFGASMIVESWASGNIDVSPQCHASLSAVWGKKVDGLLNVAIAGNCHCKIAPDGNKVGEFLVVLTGRSTVDTGFDIQSQSDVNFWLGKLTSVGVDTSCCSTGQAQSPGQVDQPVAARSLRSILVLKSVMTERSRKHASAVEALNERRRQLAIKAEEERIKKKEEAKAQADSEAKAKAEAEVKAKAEAEAKSKAEAEAKAADKKAKSKDEDKLARGADSEGSEADKEPSGAGDGSAPAATTRAKASAVIEDPRTGQTKTVVVPARKPYPDPADSPGLAMVAPSGEGPYSPRQATPGGWDSPAPPPAASMPSPAAMIMVPQRAIAGQFLTTAVLNPRHAGEHSVELSFNGATLATAQDGKALYMVPEDALPGPTLHVSLVGRPESPPIPIHVLQPLATPQGPQVPRIDRVSVLVPGGGTLTIDGHNFDGVAARNSIIIDGMWDARVLVSSPVELKADLPTNLAAGAHSVSVNTGGLRSNPERFEVVIPEVVPLTRETAKDSVRKLIVRANGTKIPVRLHVRNHTPDILRINKGNDLSVMTPGGLDNSVLIDVQRLRPGAFNVDATIE